MNANASATSNASPVPGCDLNAPKLDARPRTVSVNGVSIPRAEIARETQNHAAKTPVEAWKQAARALVIRALLRQEAARTGIAPCPESDEEGRRETDDEAMMRALIERDVQVPSADEAACQRYYAQNRAKFRSAPLYAVRHILLGAAPSDLDARDAARREGEAMLQVLAEHPGTFAELARTRSACPSGKVDGHLGQIGPGQTVPEFEKALAMMQANDQAALVETRYGVHVVLLDQKIEGESLPFDLVQPRIAAYLDEAVHRRAMAQYVGILAERATITGIDLVPDALPQTS